MPDTSSWSLMLDSKQEVDSGWQNLNLTTTMDGTHYVDLFFSFSDQLRIEPKKKQNI